MSGAKKKVEIHHGLKGEKGMIYWNPKRIKELKEGFLLILKQLESFFEKVGVEKIEAIDQAFDPTRHQAISSEEVEGKEADIVIKVMQDGFTLSDKVIRPAMVVVSK